MTDQPPSPASQPSPSGIDTDDRVLVTTSQLTHRLEDALDCSLEERELEALLLELDRGEYVDWVTVTRDGDYLWDLTESPDRVADAIAEALVDRVQSWLEAYSSD